MNHNHWPAFAGLLCTTYMQRSFTLLRKHRVYVVSWHSSYKTILLGWLGVIFHVMSTLWLKIFYTFFPADTLVSCSASIFLLCWITSKFDKKIYAITGIRTKQLWCNALDYSALKPPLSLQTWCFELTEYFLLKPGWSTISISSTFNISGFAANMLFGWIKLNGFTLVWYNCSEPDLAWLNSSPT